MVADSSLYNSPVSGLSVGNNLFIWGVTSCCGYVEDSVNIIVEASPSTGITVVSQSLSCGDTITFISNPSPTGSHQYSWNFNNGTPGSVSGTNQNGPHTVIFDSAGTQKINLDVTYNSGNCTFKDSIGAVIACVTLPVELMEFYLNETNDNIVLHWSTTTEINNHFFEVWKSYDGVNFEKIGEQPSKATFGYSNYLLNYSFKDNKPIQDGVVYYKLIQEDFDGERSKLPIVFYESSSKPSLIYPNPFSNKITFSDSQKIKRIEVYSTTGILIHSESNPSNSINTKWLAKGTYFIRIQYVNKSKMQRIIKE